ncbi:MAG: FecR domain-containing protein [Candidatus Hydrogenedentes bacterium]|nr:FecR domain-containing protein [Candidatus Hydrogenedentota bacterium]
MSTAIRFKASQTCGLWKCVRVLSIVAAMLASAAWAEDLMHARISHDSGGALVKGTGDQEWSYATVNTLILPGDTLWVNQEGILEVEMSGGSFLRLADASKAEVDQLPPSANVLAWTGSFYVQRVNRSTGNFAFRTPAARIQVEKDTQVRVDVVGDGATTVSVRWGRVIVDTDGSVPVAVGAGYRVYIDPGLLPSEPMPFDRSAEDSFDAWNRERAKTLALGDRGVPAPIQNTQPIGYSDLSNYGEWVYVDNRSYWRPTVVVDYVPYRSGYWSYVPSYGYTWVGSYPFCYTTSHYGRWTYNSGYGWLWCYDSVWSPAWAYTVRSGDYFAWAPLDLYDQPCYYGGATFTVGDVRISIGASSYCHASDLLYYGPCGTYPAYTNMFTSVNADDIYIWNIYLGDRYRDRNPFAGSTALVRDYAPQRSIRGLGFGTSTRIAANDLATQLESTRGRAVFASGAPGTAGGRSLRTAIDEGGRSSRIRSTAIGTAAAQDPRSVVRRAERNTATLRELDARADGVRTFQARNTRAPFSDASSAPATEAPRGSLSRALRDSDTNGLRGTTNRTLAPSGDAGRSSASIRERTPGTTLPDITPRSSASSGERTPARSLTRATRQPQETQRPDFSRTLTPSERGTPSERMTLPQTRSTGTSTLRERANQTERTPSTARTPWPAQGERSPLSSMSLPSRAASRDTARTPVPQIDRAPSATTRQSAPTQSQTSTPAPRITTPRFEAPSQRIAMPERTPAPETPRFESPVEAPRIASTPSRGRDNGQRMSLPSPRVETPQINRSLPSRSEAPSFSAPRNLPSRSEAPSISMPSRPSAPSRVEQPSRRIEAPSLPAPRIERPSVPDRPSFSPPDRSISGGDRGGGSRSVERPSFGGRGR